MDKLYKSIFFVVYVICDVVLVFFLSLWVPTIVHAQTPTPTAPLQCPLVTPQSTLSLDYLSRCRMCLPTSTPAIPTLPALTLQPTCAPTPTGTLPAVTGTVIPGLSSCFVAGTAVPAVTVTPTVTATPGSNLYTGVTIEGNIDPLSQGTCSTSTDGTVVSWVCDHDYGWRVIHPYILIRLPGGHVPVTSFELTFTGNQLYEYDAEDHKYDPDFDYYSRSGSWPVYTFTGGPDPSGNIWSPGPWVYDKEVHREWTATITKINGVPRVLPTPTPTLTPTVDPAGCGVYSYQSQDPLVVYGDIEITQGECIKILPDFNISLPAFGETIPAVSWSLGGMSLCPKYVEFGNYEIAGISVPADMLIIPAVMFVLGLIFVL